GDAQVDQPFELEQLAHGRTVGRLHEPHRVGGEPGVFQAGADARVDRRVGVPRFLAAAEDHRVAALDAQGGRVAGDVRARLENDQHDADGHADFLQADAVG